MASITNHSKTLVVEEDQKTAELIKSLLGQNHIEAHAFADPLLAIEVFRDDPVGYNLIICDMSVKQLSVFEFLRQVREENPDIRFVLVSTVEIKSTEFTKVLPSIRIDGFVKKSSIQDELMPLITKLFGSRKITRSNVGKYR